MLSFILFAFITSITPGPNNSMLMSSGIRFGVKRSLPHLFGINIGFGVMYLGVGSILPIIPIKFIVILEYIAMALLVYIAFKIATASTEINDSNTEDKPWGFLKAAAFQWINPKALMMAFAGTTSYGLDTVTAAAIFTATNVVCGAWIFAGSWMRQFLLASPNRTRAIYIVLAITMIGTMVF
jgi:threonine/homoserine/homoserine lactone efflux protein